MENKFSSEAETKFGGSSKGNTARHCPWRARTGLLLFLLGSRIMMPGAHAETLTATNNTPLNTPDSGVASLYPSTVAFGGLPGQITAVRVTLHDMTHAFPDDYDILLVGPGGQKALLMSDCGGSFDVSHVTLTFTDGANATLPDATQITSGAYRPINYGGPDDAFPPGAAQAYSASLATFNNTSPNGNWSLYVVDDEANDSGGIAGGWTLEIDTTSFRNSTGIIVPGTSTSGPANPYPSQITVAGFLSTIRNVRVSLFGITHTFPDDIDILLAGPGGNALIMSDVGGDLDVTNVNLVLDDAAANNLPDLSPLVSGTFKPTNIGTGDIFPLPAPVPAGPSALSTFTGTTPNGDWNLFVTDDSGGDTGTINRWTLDFDFPPTLLANIATRLRVETGDNVLIGGFIVTGTQPKRVIVRAIGPSLPLAGRLSDPTLELRDVNGALIRFNDDWRNGSGGFSSQQAEIIATGIPPSNDLESAIVATLPANSSSFTAIVRGFDTATGIALVEAYDLDKTVDSKLANISTRGLVQTGDDVLIAGTILLGVTSQKVILRALGPSLPVPGALADPTLELYDGNGVLIMANDDWKESQEADILLTTIPPSNILESAMVVTLPSGGASYTAVVRGHNGATGVAVVEAYALQ
jgi:subtilisin-like proprotein convertase family protein